MPYDRQRKAVVLFSGGLDSATALCWALGRGYRCTALSVLYGQKHSKELECASAIARRLKVEFIKLEIDLPWLGVSSLVGTAGKIPEVPLPEIGRNGIPSTYVPGRNTVFSALAVSLADSIGANAVVAGVNALDYSGYPDCRPEFFRYFQRVANLGTREGMEGKGIRVLTPLIDLSKEGIIRMALRLKVPLELTWSCYCGGEKPCGRCDSCKLRAKGFARAGVKDPALGTYK